MLVDKEISTKATRIAKRFLAIAGDNGGTEAELKIPYKHKDTLIKCAIDVLEECAEFEDMMIDTFLKEEIVCD